MKYPSSVRIYYFRAVSLTFRLRGEKGWDWSLGGFRSTDSMADRTAIDNSRILASMNLIFFSSSMPFLSRLFLSFVSFRIIEEGLWNDSIKVKNISRCLFRLNDQNKEYTVNKEINYVNN